MNNFLCKTFGFDNNQHSVKTEILAGVTTFLTMAYILAVNPSIFSALADLGMDTSATFTATALAAVVGTLVMAIYAKKPFALAPGMGLNTFFVFTVCLGMGYSWQFALSAIFIEGIIFIILTVTKVRDWIVNSIPESLKRAIGAGIGLYIAFIGLKNAGFVVGDSASLVTLGNLYSKECALFILGVIITGALVIWKVKGGILWGILATTAIGIPMGITKFGGIVSLPPSISPIFCKFEWGQMLSWDMFVVVFTFLFIDIFDTLGTVVGVAVKADMIDENGKIDRVDRIFMADAVATTVGACLGTNTTTTYIESSTGIAEGGRTGLTAFTTAVCFALALLFAPLFLAIPAAATSPVLVIVGLFMLSPIRDIDFDDYSESIPAFLTLILIPLADSISRGILFGMVSYVILNTITGKVKKISITMWVLFVIFLLKFFIK